MKKIVIIIVALFAFSAQSQDMDAFFKNANGFFEENVMDGKVAYSQIHTNPEKLNELLTLAENISVSDADVNTYQAFWINAYNLAVIKGVINNYPTNSPLEISGFFDKTTYAIGGIKITLNDIENKQLREKFKDARFHFVLVCGAEGCPPLINKAYLPNTLDVQLEKQTKIALNGSFLKVNNKKKRVAVSQIMEWYKEDFTRNKTSEIDFINRYRTAKIPTDYKLTYFPYNWKLNQQ